LQVKGEANDRAGATYSGGQRFKVYSNQLSRPGRKPLFFCFVLVLFAVWWALFKNLSLDFRSLIGKCFKTLPLRTVIEQCSAEPVIIAL
jgi:hypothetical protein